MLDPQAFLARVQYLYEHPEVEGQDRLETTDGRVIDRRTACCAPPRESFSAAIWFFRDITEEVRLAGKRNARTIALRPRSTT